MWFVIRKETSWPLPFFHILVGGFRITSLLLFLDLGWRRQALVDLKGVI